jgi:uncharacterized membrane protein
MILMVHAGTTCFMAGLIWFVQVVHYPLMGAVAADAFPAYERAHQRRTTWIVAPAMLLEGGCALLLFGLSPSQAGGAELRWIGLGLLVVVWGSTFAMQVPLHSKLERGFDRPAWRRLVRSNWLRTIAWSIRAPIALAMIG